MRSNYRDRDLMGMVEKRFRELLVPFLAEANRNVIAAEKVGNAFEIVTASVVPSITTAPADSSAFTLNEVRPENYVKLEKRLVPSVQHIARTRLTQTEVETFMRLSYGMAKRVMRSIVDGFVLELRKLNGVTAEDELVGIALITMELPGMNGSYLYRIADTTKPEDLFELRAMSDCVKL